MRRPPPLSCILAGRRARVCPSVCLSVCLSARVRVCASVVDGACGACDRGQLYDSRQPGKVGLDAPKRRAPNTPDSEPFDSPTMAGGAYE